MTLNRTVKTYLIIISYFKKQLPFCVEMTELLLIFNIISDFVLIFTDAMILYHVHRRMGRIKLEGFGNSAEKTFTSCPYQ